MSPADTWALLIVIIVCLFIVAWSMIPEHDIPSLKCSCGHRIACHLLAEVPGQDEPCTACVCGHYAPLTDVRQARDTELPAGLDVRTYLSDRDVEDRFKRIVEAS